MSRFVDIGLELIKILFAPKDELKTTEGLSDKNLRAFLEQKGISEFLMYRYYYEDDKGMGIYQMADGRKGIILRVFPTAFSSKTIENSMYSLVDTLREENTIIQFSTFASRNINHLLDNFKHLHHCNSNIDNTNILKELVDDTYSFLKSGIKDSIVDGVDFRIKDFVSTISILFPENKSDKEISQIYYQMIGNLRNLSPVNFHGNSLVTMLREMFNPDAPINQWENSYDQHREMNQQITSLGETINTSGGDHFSVGENWKYRTFTTKQFPSSEKILSSYDLYNIFFDRFGDNIQIPLPCPFFASLTVVVGNVEREKEDAAKKSRNDIKNVRKLGRDVKEQHPELEKRLEEGRRNINLIEQEDQTPMKAMFSVTLMDKNLESLNKYSKILKNRFSSKDWKIDEEIFGNISLFVFLFGLPLQYHKTVERFLRRFDILFTSNAASIAPLLGNIATSRMMVPFFDRNGQIIPYDNFSGDNYNEAKTGASGAGKSFSQAYMHIMKLSAGVMIRVIDNGGSYKRFCELVGGTYIDVGSDASISLNFFTKANTAKVIADKKETDEEILVPLENGEIVPTLHPLEVEGIVPIIGLMVGLNLVLTGKEQSASDATDESYISRKIQSAVIETFLIHQRDGKLEDTRNILLRYAKEEREDGNNMQSDLIYKVAVGMFDFADIQGGHYNKFNTPNNLDLKKDYIVLETLGLKGIILDVVLVSLASSIKSEFWKEGISREKTLDIDEGWMYKDNQIVVKILEDNARTLRKSKSGQGFITQGIEDFSANSSMQTLFSSSFHKFLLSQDKKEIQKVANGKFFPLDQYELRTFESVANKRPYWGEACYMSKKIGSNALILKASPKVYWAAAGADPDGNKEFDSIKNIHDFDNIQTIRYMTYKKKYPEMNENDLVFKSKTYSEQEMISEEERYKYWHDEIKNALKNKRIQVRAEPIYSIENNTLYGYEIFSQIKHSDQTTSSYGIIMKWLHEFQMIEEYNLYVYNRAFRYFEDIDKNIHVNISTEEIRNKGFIEKLLSLIQSYRIESKLVIELKDTVNNDNIEELQEFIKKLKSMKIKIALDNIGVHYHKMSYLMMLDVDFINIDKELTKFTKDEPASLVLELVAAFVRKDSKKKLVALKVETQEELKMIKEKNFDFYQGWILKEDEFVI